MPDMSPTVQECPDDICVVRDLAGRRPGRRARTTPDDAGRRIYLHRRTPDDTGRHRSRGRTTDDGPFKGGPVVVCRSVRGLARSNKGRNKTTNAAEVSAWSRRTSPTASLPADVPPSLRRVSGRTVGPPVRRGGSGPGRGRCLLTGRPATATVTCTHRHVHRSTRRADLAWLAAVLASVAVAGYVLASGFDQLAWERPIRPASVHQEPRTGPGA